MTIEEAIKHCEEVAEEKDKSVELYRAVKATEELITKCESCAEEHRQLAEWLKELKALKEKEPCDDCISRQAVLEMALSSRSYWVDISALFKRVNELPSVTPQPSDCRSCKKWDECPCGKDGHESGTSQGYSIGECKDFEPQESEE